MAADPLEGRSLPDHSISVRVAPEILALMKSGDAEPVVILGVQDNGDGTHDMTLMKPDIVAERDRLRAENERLLEAISAHEAKILFGSVGEDASDVDERLWAIAKSPLPSDEGQACDFCGQTDGHSKRCSVTKFGVNPKPPYTGSGAPRETDQPKET